MAMITPPPGLLPLMQALREASRTAHHRIDHHPLLAPLVRQPVALGDYRRALAALHGPQAALEAAVADLARQAGLAPRLPDLEADLADLNTCPEPFSSRLAVDCPPTLSARLGYLYVLEGANLGGAVIARHLARHLAGQLPAEVPMAFFRGAGGEARWGRFWRFMGEQYPDTPTEAMVAGALTAFQGIGDHLDAIAACDNC